MTYDFDALDPSTTPKPAAKLRELVGAMAGSNAAYPTTPPEDLDFVRGQRASLARAIRRFREHVPTAPAVGTKTAKAKAKTPGRLARRDQRNAACKAAKGR